MSKEKVSKKSHEERVEDIAKTQLLENDITVYYKTESINKEIETALKSYPSKDGGTGGNIVDIKFMLEFNGRHIPVMIEVKG